MDNKIYGINRGPGVTLKPYETGLIWGQRGKIYQSEDLSPNLGSHGNPGPDAGLPVAFVNPEYNMGVALQMCTIAAVDPESRMLVPANGGEDITIEYTSLDEQYGVLDRTMSKRVKAGETRTFKGNVPQGLILQDVLQNPACYNGMKVMLTQENGEFRKQGQVRFALLYKTDDSKYDLKIGDYLKGDGSPDRDENPMAAWGLPCKWDKEKDDLCQRALKVTYVETIDQFDTQGAGQYMQDSYGAYVHGGGTMGFPMELYNMMGQEKYIKDDTYKKIIVTASIIRG